MPAPQQPYNRARQRAYTQRLRIRTGADVWEEYNSRSPGTALVITGTGLILLLGFILAAINGAARDAALLLLFGASMTIFGGLFLLFALTEWAAKRFIHTRKHCGCCAFYHPQNEDYDVGLCLSDPRENYVQRTHTCPYFRYSERAMVRDRLSQQRDFLHQIHITQIDNGQADGDEGRS